MSSHKLNAFLGFAFCSLVVTDGTRLTAEVHGYLDGWRDLILESNFLVEVDQVAAPLPDRQACGRKQGSEEEKSEGVFESPLFGGGSKGGEDEEAENKNHDGSNGVAFE